jgi:hypothetical protein
LSSEEFALRLLDEEKLAVVPGSAFGKSGEGFLRLSYAYSIYELKETPPWPYNKAAPSFPTHDADNFDVPHKTSALVQRFPANC